ncbi:MAG: hypothetical protein KF812_06240 [Fimbriimonadaceae bacterium]|nr:hypothetical protein [Fimbriimonadaceae bacterium]
MIAAALLTPMLVALIMMLAWGRAGWHFWLGTLGSVTHLAITFMLGQEVWNSGPIALQVGEWGVSFGWHIGIVLIADQISVLMLGLTGVIGLATQLYAAGTIDRPRWRFGYFPLVQFLLFGVSGAFLTGDLFNLFVWFEVLLIASFVLVALGGERKQLAGGLKYVALNLLSSALFLSGCGLLYATSGTLNMSDLSAIHTANPGLQALIGTILLAAFGIKAAAFPFFMWMPAAYPAPPASVAALFAGLMTKVGVVAIVRLLYSALPGLFDHLAPILICLAILSMAVGSLGVIAARGFRRMLAFSSVSQIGFILLGVSMGGAGLVVAVYYILQHSVAKTGLFLIAGEDERGNQLPKWASAFFFVFALSLAGIPPTAGFLSKFGILSLTETVSGPESALLWLPWAGFGVGIVSSIFTTVGLYRFGIPIWQRSGVEEITVKRPPVVAVGVALLATVSICLSLFAGSVFSFMGGFPA